MSKLESIFDTYSEADEYITVDKIKYIRIDKYIKLQEGSTKLAYKYEKLLDLIGIIKTETKEIDMQKEYDVFSDLTDKNDIPY